MSNNEIMSPTETERRPFRNASRDVTPEKEGGSDSPTRPTKVALKGGASPTKSVQIMDEKSPMSLSELEKTQAIDSKAGTKTKIVDSTDNPEERRKRNPSRVLNSKTGSRILDEGGKRRTKKMTMRHGTVARRRRQEEENEFDFNGQSNSDIYNIQTFFHKALKIEEGQPDSIEKKDEAKKTLKKYAKILKYKLNQEPGPIDIPPFFEETRHRINEEREIPKSEQLRDIEIGEKGDLEILRDKKDDYPLFQLRKKISKILILISLVCEKFVNHGLFDGIILIFIVFNSIVLAFDDPLAKGESYPAWIDTLFLIVYTMEAVLKIIAKGFLFSQKAYLKELWNMMDFVIVVTAYLPYILTSGGVNLKALRALRVLRPLRTISKIKKLRELILTLMSVFSDLIETLFVLFFFLMIFAIGGLQMFIGLSKKRCFESTTGIFISTPGENPENGNQAYCNEDTDCVQYSETSVCGKMIAVIDYGTTNYDDFFHAYLMSFQVITTEGWTQIMGIIQKTFNPWVCLYFIVLVLCATFIILQLILAVLNGGFQTAAERIAEETSTKKGRKKVWHENEGLVKALDKNKVDIVDLLLKRREGTNNTARYKMKKSGLYPIEDRFSLAAFLGFASSMAMTKKKKGSSKESKISFLQKFKIKASNPTPGSRFADVVMKLKDLNKSLIFDDRKQTYPNIDDPNNQSKTEQDALKRTDTIVVQNHFGMEPIDPSKKDVGSKAILADETLNNQQNTLKTTVSMKNFQDNTVEQTLPLPIEQTPKESSKTPSTDRDYRPLQIKINRLTPESTDKLNTDREISTPAKSPLSHDHGEEPETPAQTDRKILYQASKLRPIINTKPFTNTGPLRPDHSNKISLNVELSEMSNRKPFQIVGIAGIRSNFKPEAKKVAFAEPEPEKEAEDDDDFLEAVKNMAPAKNIKPESTLSAKFFKKINNAQPKNLAVPIVRAGKSYQTIDIDGDDISDNAAETLGVLDDSDFIEEKARNHKYEKTIKRRKSQVKTEIRVIKKGYETAADEGHLAMEENDVGAKQENLETEHIDDEEDEDFPLDLRLIQPDPVFARQDYNSYSEDDVLPSLKENKRRAEEEEDMKRIKEVTLLMEHIPTQTELKQAQARKDKRNNEMVLKAAKTISIKKSLSARRDKKEEDRKRLEKEAEDALEDQYLADRANSKKLTRHFNAVPKNALNLPGVCENNGEFSSYDLIGKRIDAKNEDEEDWLRADFVDENTTEIPKIENWLQIRNEDIKANRIKVKKEWSGVQVLVRTYPSYPINLAKDALNEREYDIWRPGFLGVIHQIRKIIILKFVQTNLFGNFILITVFLNVLTLAADSMVTSEAGSDLLAQLNQIFTYIFITEMGLKLIAMGIIDYASDKMNLFDALIVSISILEMAVLTGPNKAASAFRAVRLFRTFRVLRVTKLLRSLAYMKIIMGVISRSISKMTWIFVLMILFLYIYTLLGMQMFGGNLTFRDNVGDGKVRQSYDDFVSAFMTTFQVMTQENWNTVLVFSYRSPDVNNFVAIIYLISWLCIGNWVFLNLLLATVLDEFTNEDAKQDEKELKDEEEEIAEAESKELNGNLLATQTRTNPFAHSSLHPQPLPLQSQKSMTRSHTTAHAVKQQEYYAPDDDDDEEEKIVEKVAFDYSMREIKCKRSLYIFSKFNPIRKVAYRIVKDHHFEHAIFFAIFISSMKLVVDTYIEDESDAGVISGYIDYGINGFFMLECILKIMTFGFFLDKRSYLRDSWSILDFFIVCASILDMSLSTVKLNFIKILRLLRVLRPLRFVSHNKGMKLVVTALLTSASGIASVAIVIVMIWLMFDILAVNIVGGKLGYCNFGDFTNYTKYHVSQAECEAMGFYWDNYIINFDNVFSGMLSCFVLSTQEGWPDIMFILSDANDADSGPNPGGNAAFAYVFFIVFLLIGTYFLVNLFIGVIFQKFSEAQEKEMKGDEGLKKAETKWVVTQRLIVVQIPDTSLVEPKMLWMKKFFKIITNPFFDTFIMLCIIANIITMALVYDTMSKTYETNLKYLNYFFSGVFIVEMILKNLGLGPKRYWGNTWNRFDFFVVMASILDIAMDFLQQNLTKAVRVAPQLARIFRVLRVSRLLKLIKKFQGLQKIINTLVFSLPQLANVGALVLLVFFIFSVLAVFLFGNIKTGSVISDWTNFQSFSNAFLTLFACATGENWYMIMFDTFNPNTCVDGSTDCGQPFSAPIFWIAFITIAQYIALNLFILVVIQQFEEYHIAKDNPVEDFKKMLEKNFKPIWLRFTLKHGANKLYESQLVDFFCELEEPLGYKSKKGKEKTSRTQVAKEIFKLDVASAEGFIHYNDMLYSCFKRAIQPEKSRARGKAAEILAKEEKITKDKLDNLRRKFLYDGLALSALKRQTSTKTKKDTANPLFRALFVGMTMKAWLNYAIRKNKEWDAMKDITDEITFSDSDDEDYEISYSDDEGIEQQQYNNGENEEEYEEDEEYEDDEEEERLEQVKEEDEEDEELMNSKEMESKDVSHRQMVLSATRTKNDALTEVIRRVGSTTQNNFLLDADDANVKNSSKLGSNNKLDEEERPSSIINYNINNNFIINNNYFIHPDNPTSEPIRQTNVILERNVTVSAQPNTSLRQLQSQNSRDRVNGSDRAIQNGSNNKDESIK